MKTRWLLILAAALLLTAAPASADSVTLYVDDDMGECPDAGYTSIQDAIDDADPGDTVSVCAGTYGPVTIGSDDYDLSLEGHDATIDGGSGSSIVLHGGAHHISISGFEIVSDATSDTAGIDGWTNPSDSDFAAMHDITIHHNDISGNYDGINIGAWVWSPYGPPLWTHYNINIHHNSIHDNSYRGIDWWAVSDSTIAHNKALDNAGDGITWVGVEKSTATHNQLHRNGVVGLSVNLSRDNNLNHNDVTDNGNIGILTNGLDETWCACPTTGNTFVHNDARDNPSWDIAVYGNTYGNTWVKNAYGDSNADPLP